MFSKRDIRNKTIQVGNLTLMSRILGLIREILMARYLGASLFSDAFFTAFKIPNSLRKIFAEGALSAAFIPTFSALMKAGEKKNLNKLMSVSFLIVEGVLIFLCIMLFVYAEWVVYLVAPGWFMQTSHSLPIQQSLFNSIIYTIGSFFTQSYEPALQACYAVYYLRILVSFIVYISSSALLAGALQSVGHFFVPACAPVILNLFFISGISFCLYFSLSVDYLCIFILIGGITQFFVHLFAYFMLNFSFGPIDKEAWQLFAQVMRKFFPCLLSMSIMEIYFFVDSSLASFLTVGSITLIYYANRFMGIPLGVIARAFSTILLPYFSRIAVYAPKRFSFLLFEAAKLIFWVTMPIALFMAFFSDTIFLTLFVSKKFTCAQALQAGSILIAFLYGLFFFSFNTILLNVFYALHETMLPMYIVSLCALINFSLSYYVFMPLYGVYGIALATTITSAIQMFLYLFFLYRYFKIAIYVQRFFIFIMYCAVQLLCGSIFFLSLYYFISWIFTLLPEIAALYLLKTVFIWIWVLPIAGIVFFCLYVTRDLFSLKLYFLE